MQTDRPSVWVVGLSLLVLVAAGFLTWTLTRPTQERPYVVPVPTETAGRSVDASGASQTLQRLVSALTTGDRAAAAVLAGENPTAAVRLADLVAVAEEAQIEDVTMRYIDADGVVSADGSWAATVDVTWAYADFDDRPAAADVSMRFVSSDGGVVLAGLGGGGLRTPVWMSGPMQVSRSDNVLVVAADGLDLDAYVRLARAALPRVSAVIRRWRPRLVVEIPADTAALEAALDAAPGYYTQIAAVTGAGGILNERAPIHIFVNRDVFGGLGRAGREVVLTHEATHVATNAPLSEAPAWLVEGFADYVALRNTKLPLTRTAGQIIAQVRGSGLPDGLPAASAFDTRGPQLGATYEASWLLCVTLEKLGGEGNLRVLYERVSRGESLRSSLRLLFGLTEADLLEAWQRVLRALPGVDA